MSGDNELVLVAESTFGADDRQDEQHNKTDSLREFTLLDFAAMASVSTNPGQQHLWNYISICTKNREECKAKLFNKQRGKVLGIEAFYAINNIGSVFPFVNFSAAFLETLPEHMYQSLKGLEVVIIELSASVNTAIGRVAWANVLPTAKQYINFFYDTVTSDQQQIRPGYQLGKIGKFAFPCITLAISAVWLLSLPVIWEIASDSTNDFVNIFLVDDAPVVARFFPGFLLTVFQANSSAVLTAYSLMKVQLGIFAEALNSMSAVSRTQSQQIMVDLVDLALKQKNKGKLSEDLTKKLTTKTAEWGRINANSYPMYVVLALPVLGLAVCELLYAREGYGRAALHHIFGPENDIDSTGDSGSVGLENSMIDTLLALLEYVLTLCCYAATTGRFGILIMPILTVLSIAASFVDKFAYVFEYVASLLKLVFGSKDLLEDTANEDDKVLSDKITNESSENTALITRCPIEPSDLFGDLILPIITAPTTAPSAANTIHKYSDWREVPWVGIDSEKISILGEYGISVGAVFVINTYNIMLVLKKSSYWLSQDTLVCEYSTRDIRERVSAKIANSTPNYSVLNYFYDAVKRNSLTNPLDRLVRSDQSFINSVFFGYPFNGSGKIFEAIRKEIEKNEQSIQKVHEGYVLSEDEIKRDFYRLYLQKRNEQGISYQKLYEETIKWYNAILEKTCWYCWSVVTPYEIFSYLAADLELENCTKLEDLLHYIAERQNPSVEELTEVIVDEDKELVQETLDIANQPEDSSSCIFNFWKRDICGNKQSAANDSDSQTAVPRLLG